MEHKKLRIPMEGFGEAVRKTAAEGIVLLKMKTRCCQLQKKTKWPYLEDAR